MNRMLIPGLLALALTGCGGGDSDKDKSGPVPTGVAGSKAQRPAGPQAAADSATSVRAVQVAAEAVQPWIYGQGTARAVRREFLTFPTAGRIAYVDPKLKVGDRVKKGQLIAYQQPDRAQAELANARAGVSGSRTDLAVAQASQREALANLALARATFQRFKTLLDKRSASQQEFDEAEAKLASATASKAKADAQIAAIEARTRASTAQLGQAQVTFAESRIVSPIDGVLARLNIEQGYYFSPQTVQSTSEQGALSTIPVFIIDPSAYEVAVDLPAYSIGKLSVGTSVAMNPQEYTGTEAARSGGATGTVAAPPADSRIAGRVHSITPSIDPEKRTFQVKARTVRGQALLSDGQFLSLWIEGDKAATTSPVVPFDALRYDDGKPFVFVVDPASRKVARRGVSLGPQGRGTQTVVSGLKAGEWVVTEGRSGLADGDTVRLLESTSGQPEQR